MGHTRKNPVYFTYPHELLAGQRPYDVPYSPSPEVWRRAILGAKYVSLRQYDREFSNELDAIVAKTLAQEPAQRYQSVAALHRDLKEYCDLQRERQIRRLAAVSEAEALRGAIQCDPPMATPHWVGRHSLLAKLHATWTAEAAEIRPQVLCGLPGSGKTQIAVKYWHQYAQEYDRKWWINAATTETLRDDYLTLACGLT